MSLLSHCRSARITDVHHIWLYFILWVWVFCLSGLGLYVLCIVCVQYLHEPKEGIRSSEVAVTGDSEPVGARNWTWGFSICMLEVKLPLSYLHSKHFYLLSHVQPICFTFCYTGKGWTFKWCVWWDTSVEIQSGDIVSPFSATEYLRKNKHSQ